MSREDGSSKENDNKLEKKTKSEDMEQKKKNEIMKTRPTRRV